jgi:hypothetical protein
MNLNPEDYKGKTVYLCAPLANNSPQVRQANLEALHNISTCLEANGAEIRTSNDPVSPKMVEMLFGVSEFLVLELPCSLEDERFFEQLKDIYASKKPFSLLSYPDLNLEPIRFHSKFLTKENRRKRVTIQL